MLAQMMAALLESHGSREDVLSALRKNSSSIWKFFIENGIDILDLAKAIDYTELEHWHIHWEAEVLMEGYLDNMLSWSVSHNSDFWWADITKLSDYEVIDLTKERARRTVEPDDEEPELRNVA